MILRCQAILLVFMLMIPVAFTSITKWGDTGYASELCDNFPEEEREERESEKDEVDDVKEFMSHHRHNFSSCGGGNSLNSSANNVFANIGGDVVTPPPEFI